MGGEEVSMAELPVGHPGGDGWGGDSADLQTERKTWKRLCS